MRRGVIPATVRHNNRRGVVPENHRSVLPPFQEKITNFNGNCPKEQRPSPAADFKLDNYVVVLHFGNNGFCETSIEALILCCSSIPENFCIFSPECLVAAKMFFKEWSDVVEALVFFWEQRLDGIHLLDPSVKLNEFLPFDMEELNERLKDLFVSRVKSLLDGEEVKRWQKKLELTSDEIAEFSASLKKPQSIVVFDELMSKKKGLVAARELIAKRIREFRSAMNCILNYFNGLTSPECRGNTVEVLRFSGDFDWSRIHHVMLREIRRLDQGLPIYASRKELLEEIHRQQVMVLIGETGSGKSTQLVQFLADSGIGAEDFIICTQPRKIAAMSLAQRVMEESKGCYEDNLVACYPTYSSTQGFNSKVVFMTDHCLLQRYMKDKNLSKISCIIVDEAHERSLNTDLLLALLKDLLNERPDLRLIIMSATADAEKLSDYYSGCTTFRVVGRNFPVEIKYVPCASEGTSAFSKSYSGACASYVSDVVNKATEIHRAEEKGAVLAFLTSQMEVEWACENFQVPNAVVLPLHGKLSNEEQNRVFHDYSGKRKVIFATNLAETSLTLPGVKYVVDSGMVKESRFEPSTGMNVLKVCRVSQSSADQRAGRAGRTAPGKCYRMYSKNDFQSMPSHQEPEIRRVHLGVAVLRILALGIKNVQEFDFVDAPSPKAIDMAIRNLLQLGAITFQNGSFELTDDGLYLVKLGIEPRLGKLILGGCCHGLHKEGLVLAAVMPNGSSIFCRVGTDEEKLKADRLKVQFCHQDGDLLTLLSVYKEWEDVPQEKKNKWCWDNSINAKTMRRCKETVLELEHCLKGELNIIVTGNWLWNPRVSSEHDKNLKRIILSSLSENVAMYSGYDRLGYEVALTGQHVQLHPSCSLLIYGRKPCWVVFGELLSISNEYLVCVTAFDLECLSTLCPCPLFNISQMESRKLQSSLMTGFVSIILKRFCGKSNYNLHHLVSRIQTACMDRWIGIEVDVEKGEIQLFGTAEDMGKVSSLVDDALHYEMRWLRDECIEKCLYRGGLGVSSVALFGSGAEIKHLELEKRFLAVDVFHPDAGTLDDKELLITFENCASGICGFQKYTCIGQDSENREKWGRITFLTPEAAEKAAAELDNFEFNGNVLKVSPSWVSFGGDVKMHSFPAVKAKVSWPRRYSKGCAIIKCAEQDLDSIIDDCSNLLIGGRLVRCELGKKYMDSVVMNGLDKEISEQEILDILRTVTDKRILDVFLIRGDAVTNLPSACEEALLREIAPFMPMKSSLSNCCNYWVQVFPPEPTDYSMRALITFDGRLHLEAAKALQHLQGYVLPVCLPWQKIRCQQMFYSSVSCPGPVYPVVKTQLDSLLQSFKHRKGVFCNLERNENGSFRVKISANATKTVAELRKPLEQLMKGTTIKDASLTPNILQLLFTKDGMPLIKSIQRETGTYILYDRQNMNIKVFGLLEKIAVAEKRLVQSLLSLHEDKQLEIHLRGAELPPNLMKAVVEKFGPDLQGLKEKVPGAEFMLNIRRHVILVRGNKESKQKVEDIIYEFMKSLSGSSPTEQPKGEDTCPICLCEVEDCYQLQGCAHLFCRLCLVEQCESAIKSHDGFPLRCTHEGCETLILLADLKGLLSSEKLEDLFRASLGAYVAASGGTYRFCSSPDCPSVYRVADPGTIGEPFACGACYVETCTSCHLEYHPFVSCERYKEFKDDPDLSLQEWCKGKEQVKVCPACGFTIEKVDGCNHIECKCGSHICWVCLELFNSSDKCYDHMRSHLDIFEI
ncbi:ATP-dependent RNA helicase DEAH12, chloroplastic-like [Telopea speciosissima]|uniref:ATP-dependent RNA helicase DEAH12, chloroplastic-like n=1 Tax=Telopea speciosissima TaxID=54955 RepID=UPI001CC39883|nr:ATP-dependent RNA helicase DEAH12, chloroplastic-like [Telopea speciosissima]